MSLKPNDFAPDFSLPADDGSVFQLSAQRGQRLLLVFYPGDETPVCTAQLCDYRDGLSEFGDLGVEVVGISSDDAASHQRFKARHGLPFKLLTDADSAVAKAYGAYGLLGSKRAVFLVDEHGQVRYQHVEAVALFRRTSEELVAAIRALQEH